MTKEPTYDNEHERITKKRTYDNRYRTHDKPDMDPA